MQVTLPRSVTSFPENTTNLWQGLQLSSQKVGEAGAEMGICESTNDEAEWEVRSFEVRRALARGI